MALMCKTPVKLLIIGGGVTGALTANLINREKNSIETHIWEANADVGGRMYTAVNPSCESCRADLGAQYITTTLFYIRNHAQFYEELLEANVLKSLKGKMEGLRKPMNKALNFVAPSGMGSIVKHFLNSERFLLSCNEKLTKIELDNGGNRWTASTSSGKTDTYDVVVLTLPLPELLEVEGIKPILEASDAHDTLQGVQYSSRFALALFYNSPQEYFEKLPWMAKYVSDGEVIRFISIDHKKRGNPSDLPSVVAHSTVEFGAAHLKDDLKNVQNLLLSELQRMLPEMPSPSHMKCHVWKCSQVKMSYPERCGCVVINESPLLIAGGDAFTESTFDGCIDSALRIVEETLKHLT